MRTSVRRALRGILAGVAGLAFVIFFLLTLMRTTPVSVLIGVLTIGILSLAASGGLSTVLRLFGYRNLNRPSKADEKEWWLARLEPVLEESWNRWSDLVLTIGLGAVGTGSFLALIFHPTDDPPLGLLILGFLGINCALISLAFLFE